MWIGTRQRGRYQILTLVLSEMKNMIHKQFTFDGWVQGDGFRYRARHAAELYD